MAERNVMKLKMITAGILLTLPFWVCAKDVTIIYTNDLHAHVEPYKVPYIADGKRDIGGWANITTLVKEEKAKTKQHGSLMRVIILPAHISVA
jgi:2',3'-cyclic-nucleotide 2'-phosphodiesterase (5'-nucleotidase family)